jgi:tetratricopeptide (TPR) repeat protein
MLGDNCSVMGYHREASKWFERGYSAAEKQQNQHYEVYILMNLGMANRRLGDYETARGYFQKALTRAETYQMPVESMAARQYLSDLSLFLGNLHESIAGSQQSIALAKEKYSVQNVSNLTNLSVSQWLAGDFDNAIKSIELAVDITQQQSNVRVVFSNVSLVELLTITGRYRQAASKIVQINDWLRAFNMDNWPDLFGRLARIRGWLALLERDFLGGLAYLETSIEGVPRNGEIAAWSLPYLALAHYWLGDPEQTRELLIEALSATIKIKGYLPMVFALPVTLLLLAEEDLEFKKKVYRQIRRDRFMSNAQLFHDLVYKHLPEDNSSISVETVEHSDEHREALWETARVVLKKLTDN